MTLISLIFYIEISIAVFLFANYRSVPFVLVKNINFIMITIVLNHWMNNQNLISTGVETPLLLVSGATWIEIMEKLDTNDISHPIFANL